MSKLLYESPLAESLEFEVDSAFLSVSTRVQDGSLTYYAEEDNQFA